MRNLLFFGLLCAFTFTRAQDTLYFANSEKKVVLIVEINPDNVKYKRFDNQEGPVYTSNKSDLKLLVFSSGVKETFGKTEAKPQNDVNVQNTGGTGMSGGGGSIPDTLFFKSGKMSLVWIKIIAGNDVKYKLWNYEDGPDYTASKSELKSVHYANGRIETFDKPAYEYSQSKGSESRNSEYSAAGSGINYYQKGQSDAIRYYRHNGGSIGTGVSTALCSPACGLAVAIPVALHEPSAKNLGIPPSGYSANGEYISGYATQAHIIKKRRVWTAYGVGSAVFIAAVILWILSYQ